MPNFREKKGYAPKFLGIRINKDVVARGANAAALTTAKKRIYWQAGLAGVTVLLTLVITFAMTSAWYTNIAQSSGLTFEAEAWGFEGTIKVNEDPIVAGPGDDGVIQLLVNNESDTIVDVGVNVSKAKMDSDMQQRLYFYVDTQQERNGETMNRIYLNNQEGYNYTLFSKGNLTLAEDVHNDAQLKWQWVYDVLGYYVYGVQYDTDTGSNVQVKEYLRPIEYDYDAATTTFRTDENNNQILLLDTVDGETTVEEFLVELSKTDGYKGKIDPEQKLDSGFYPVSVKKNADGDTYGVYAYLCSYGEIELATQFDTDLGQKAAAGELKEKYVAQLMVSAQKKKNNTVNVTSLAGLQEVISTGMADVIQLSGNITVPADESLVIAEGQKIMLDLNNYTIVSENPNAAIKVAEGGSLTMVNGTVDGSNADTTNGIYAIGSEVLLNKVNVTGCDVGVRIADNEGEKALDAKVHLVDCQIDGSNYGVIVKGNGSDSDQLTQLILENCTVTSDSVCISGNGSENQTGTDIQVINSIIKGNTYEDETDKVTTGIFHPQVDSKLTIYKSTVVAGTAVAIKGGSVSVIDSHIEGTGQIGEPSFQNSGCSDTGDGIYIETNYEGNILLEISENSKITSEYANSLRVFEPDARNFTIRIYSGVFDEKQPDSYIAEGSEQTENSEGGYKIAPKES